MMLAFSKLAGYMIAVVAVIAIGVIIGCKQGSSGQESSTAHQNPASVTGSGYGGSGVGTTVYISDFEFQPQTLRVASGTTVTWMNKDKVKHTVVSGIPSHPGDGPLNGTLDGQGTTYTFLFKDPGEYHYFCDRHPDVPTMRGTVVVSKQ